ncbi:uncharacterized protein MKK02DRAFT_42051 [Dioszegia hungarica]|uniref:DUF6534 domain-containing protein n=1 Tax=Dioszegia hungarica TaxID=4972 RepID=A0AA38LYJ0_9TREE|nr:uncharacterized protein MKK02DRAFT_42051 [Dioszegia hungarica]KAI9639014.1 hypothetical protein MKK02DRAFT_42051 [Dioszegia hungarica]
MMPIDVDPQQLEMMSKEAIDSMRGVAIGAPFLGMTFDALLMGVIICQMVHWIPLAKQDVAHVRVIVGVAATAALVGTAFTWAAYMQAFVFSFGQYAPFTSLEYLGWYGTLDILIVLPVQTFFAERSWRINGQSTVLLCFNAILIAATGAMGIATTVVTRGEDVFNRTQTSCNIATAWPGVCIFTHVWLTATILFGLFRSRSLSQRANRLLTRVLMVSIESQLPSTIVALMIMTVLLVDYKSPIIPFIAITHPKIFCVGLLAMVNLRHTWRIQGKTTGNYSVEPSDRTRTIHVSLGSTVDEIGLTTPKADMNEDDCQLSRQQSDCSVAEAGMGVAMHALRSEYVVKVKRNGQSFQY